MCTANSALTASQMSKFIAAPPACNGDALAAESTVDRAESSISSFCTSDYASAFDSPRPLQPPLSVPLEKALVPYKPFDPGPSEDTLSPTERERQLIIQNHLLKSTLIRTLERLQMQIEDNSKTRQLLSRLLELRSAQQAQQAAEPSAGGAQDPDRAELYRKYEALVKQNYQLEQALLQSGRQVAAGSGGAHDELEEYKAMVKIQMSTVQQDWQEERAEKERALALNAQLHQQVEQLQLQLQQLQQRQRQLQQQPEPLSEPFETLDPSGFTTASSWGTPASTRSPARPMLPPPGYSWGSSGALPTRRSGQEVRTRGVGPARSVDEVLSAPYETIRAAPLPPPGRRPPVESDLRRPAPLVPRDSGYSDLLLGAEEGSDAGRAPLLSRGSDASEPDGDWVAVARPAGSTDALSAAERCRGEKAARRETTVTGSSQWTTLTGPRGQWTCLEPESKPAAAAAAAAAAARDSAISEEYAVTNTTTEITCPHCGAVFAVNEHLVYLNHLEVCPARRPRRQPPAPACRR